MIIYKVENEINGKCYIGQTVKTLKQRKQGHTYRTNGGSQLCFCCALRKYGFKNFKWEVLCECDSKEELDEMEFHYIKQYNSFSPNGYNLTLGGDFGTYGWVPSEETRQNMRNARKNFIPWNKGKKNCYSNETIEKIRQAKKGKVAYTKISEEDVREILDLFFKKNLNLSTVGKIMRNGRRMSYKRALSLLINESYGVTVKCIEKIIDGETWKNVYKEYQI
jgi:group I intron endonuclease